MRTVYFKAFGARDTADVAREQHADLPNGAKLEQYTWELRGSVEVADDADEDARGMLVHDILVELYLDNVVDGVDYLAEIWQPTPPSPAG